MFVVQDDDDDVDDEEETPQLQRKAPNRTVLKVKREPLNYLDSQGTNSPNGSPSHEAKVPPPPPVRGVSANPGKPPLGRLKPSDSSFGLHSPDNLPLGFNPEDDKVQVIRNTILY